MAIDHTLAENFQPGDNAIFRFYGWTPHAISMGFHQNVDDFNHDAVRQDGFDITRRPTGGRAIFHGNELTYAIIHPLILSKEIIYQNTHVAFIDAFQQLGIPLAYHQHKTDFRQAYQSDKSASCFANKAMFEVTQNGKKVIGSAQRVYKSSILQHGSIMLSDDFRRLQKYLTHKPHATSDKEDSDYIELSAYNRSIQELMDAIIQQLKIHFSIDSVIENPYSLSQGNLSNQLSSNTSVPE